MNATDVMSRVVVTVGPDTPLAAAASLMVAHRISGLPVIDDGGRLVGMITEADLLHRVETGTDATHRGRFIRFLLGTDKGAGEYVATHGRHVEHVMTSDVAFVSDDATLQDIVDLMDSRHIRRVPVLRDGALVGVVSRLDLVRALARRLAGLPGSIGETDIEIQNRLASELEQQQWARAARVTIAVEDNVVTLRGMISDERVRRALNVAACNVAEGITVQDEMVWSDPNAALALGL